MAIRFIQKAPSVARTLLNRTVPEIQSFSKAALFKSNKLSSRFSVPSISPRVSRRYSTVAMATSEPRKYPYGPQVDLKPYPVSVEVSSSKTTEWQGDLLVIGVFEDSFETKDDISSIVNEDLKSLDAEFGGALSDIVSLFKFNGKSGSSQTVRVGKNAKFVSLVGLGPSDKATATSEWGLSVWQTFGNSVASAAKTISAKTAAVTLVAAPPLSEKLTIAATRGISNGITNGGYESYRFKAKVIPPTLAKAEILFGSTSSAKGTDLQASIAQGIAMGTGALLTRFLVEAPPNVCTPTYLVEAAAGIVDIAPTHMKLKVLEKEQCEVLGMGCYLGVAEASAEPPKFIHLTYTPSNEVKRRIAIVGKGLTFDSGGYNLKAGAGSMIEMMKFDMGGSGATLGAAYTIAELKPDNVEIHFIIAACENMVDARGLRPGDILVASNGKTVEVNNTDAEGRLTLCDALLYAQNQCNAEAIVDIATLTGACMIGLGGGIGGMYASTDVVASKLTAAAQASGEKLWRMPLEDSYMEQLKSPIADLKNTGGRMGGSITAALFLKEFMALDKVEWAHLDIAGPVWDDKLGGATGFGAQVLAEWAINEGKNA